MEKYFVNEGDHIEFYGTELEARTAADDQVAAYRAECDPEWPEGVEYVCWGELTIRGKSVEALGDDDHYSEYKLVDVVNDKDGNT